MILVTFAFSDNIAKKINIPDEQIFFNGVGQLEGVYSGGCFIRFLSDIRVFKKNWDSFVNLNPWVVSKIFFEHLNKNSRKWEIDVPFEGNNICITQYVKERNDGAFYINAAVRNLPQNKVQEVQYIFKLPSATFCDSEVVITDSNGVKSIFLSESVPAEPRLFNSKEVKRITIRKKDEFVIDFILDENNTKCLLQDERFWGGKTDNYGLCFSFANPEGINDYLFGAKVVCSAKNRPEDVCVYIGELDGHLCKGWGGNYCFAIDSEETRKTLHELSPAIGRVSVKASDWEPQNDNDSPTDINWKFFEEVASKSSELQNAFEIGSKLSKSKVPIIASIWAMPEWLYKNKGDGPYGRIIDEKMWGEMAECIVSYLIFAKKKYKWEPILLSFNEPDYGVNVKFSMESYPRMVQFLGSAFRAHGIRTKFLLGDTTTPGSFLTYIDGIIKSTNFIQYSGAVSFHSWGGALPAEYAAIRAVSYTHLTLPTIYSV